MSWRLRLRALLDAWFEVLAIALVVILLLGAWGTYATHVEPGTTTEERVESSWAMEGSFEHEAMVTESNPIYPRGTRLDNRSIYPANIAPEMNGTFVFGYEASDSGDLDTEMELVFYRRSIVEREENELLVWEYGDGLATRTESAVAPGTELTEPFSINVSAAENETQQIEEEIGQVPGEIETSVRVDVHVSGTVNGRSVDEERTYILSMDSDGDAYQLSQNAQPRDEFQSTVRIPVERSYSPVRRAGAPLVLVGSLVLLSGLFVAKRRGLALNERERAYLAYRDDREDFDEWITTMSLSDDVDTSSPIEAASLGDLVDFAIDTDSGVVYDPDRDVYVVFHHDSTYVYRPPNDERFTEATDQADDPPEEPD